MFNIVGHCLLICDEIRALSFMKMIFHALKFEVVEIEALEKAERIYGLHQNIYKPAEPYSATGGSVA